LSAAPRLARSMVASARLLAQLEGSSNLFLCAGFCRAPLLYTYAIAIALLQSSLLLLVWSRAEGNMFYEFYSHGMINVSNLANLQTSDYWKPTMVFPSKEEWSSLGRTGEEGGGIAAAGSAGGASFAPPPNASLGLERYHVMIEWSDHHPFLPRRLTHPDLQLDYALIFSLALIVLWVAKDAVDAVLFLKNGMCFASLMTGMNVFLALATGWDQMYVKFLPIFVWDVPANVMGVSPISMILDSVAVMLILDLDEKAYGFIQGVAHSEVARLDNGLKDEVERHRPLSSLHEVV